MSDNVLDLFSPATSQWFAGAFAAPTDAQVGAWRAAHAGDHSLVIAPTGSGKTLAAFLWALDRLANEPLPENPTRRCRVLYVSPLKALAMDVQRNLRAPLAGIAQTSHHLGVPAPDITVGMRTGDTTSSERRAFLTTPPDILVTTPESLFLLLTSSARESLRGVETVILDEVHAIAAGKRGAHLAVSLERLDALLEKPAQRIGLSATVRPVDEISGFLGGNRPVQVISPPSRKTIEIQVEVPVEDMSTLDSEPRRGIPLPGLPSEGGIGTQEEITGATVNRPSIWPAVEGRVLELIQQHRSTIVFANSRRLAERLTARLNELASEQRELRSDQRFPAEAIGQSSLTTGAMATVAKAHHGSMSREQRTQVEEELKSGTLPCVVATSSLELGIDMGAVDLVVQIEAPPTVASGLQRVGRAGHQVGEISRGVIFPKFRGDLVSCAVTAERMAQGGIEAVRYLRNPLDVLAQHIVSMVAMETWTVEELGLLIRRSAPFAALPEDALTAVLDMLSGRYPSEEFGELRPRITWNRTTGELRGRPGSQRLAVTSGGTIPDRGLFTVTTPGEEVVQESTGESGSRPKPGRRVGELDEEMVYESRVGDTILLGTSSWRVVDITHDRVIVVPAPGEPARMPFWKGDAPGRPWELGQALGAFVRELSTMDSDKALARARKAGLNDEACDNLFSYLTEQKAATRYIPNDRTVVLERFRDELGDWRVVLHSPFGAQVNAPWALAIAARLRENRGIDAKVAHSDDGIVLRLPDALDADGVEIVIDVDDVLFTPEEVEPLIVGELGGSSLFASRFRECAARSLLLPRRNPGRRSPLWQQRQRAAQLMSVAAKYERFPVVLEAMRECLQDVYDMSGFRDLMSRIEGRSIRVVDVETPSPSPFARSLLFGYVGMFLYETDSPLAERRAAALALDSTLLAELLGAEAIRELLDPEVITEVERSLQRLAEDRKARDVEDTADMLRFLGDLTPDEAALRGSRLAWLSELESDRRAIRVRIAGEERFLAIEDASRVRDALGVALPVGLPEAFTEPVADPLGDLFSRYARAHGPFTAAQAAQRFGLSAAVAVAVLDKLTSSGRLVRGELSPITRHQDSQAIPELPLEHSETDITMGMEYCDSGVLQRIRRASLAKLRSEVEPVDQAALGRFLPIWHGIDSTRRSAPSADDVLSIIEQLAGVPLPASAVESLVLPSRLPGYQPALLDELTLAGEVTWAGCGTLTGTDGWISLAPTELAGLLLPDRDELPPQSQLHELITSTLKGGALFFRQLIESVSSEMTDAPSESEVVTALWDLVWSGVITGDTLGPLRALVSGKSATHKSRNSTPRGRYARMRLSRISTTTGINGRTIPPIVAGRWALTPDLEANLTRRASARTEAFLERHGVLTRGALETERITGGFSGIYKVLRGMEDSGQVIRGYIVEGLGAAQFAARGAVDQIREFSRNNISQKEKSLKALVLAATDPAQPYGAALAWPAPIGDTKHRPARKAGALTVLVDGAPVLYVERGGRSLLSFTTDNESLKAGAQALSQLVREGRLNQLTVLRADGEFAVGSALSTILQEAGFRATPKGLRLRG